MLTDLSDARLSFENLELQEIPLKQELEFLENISRSSRCVSMTG